MGGALTFYKKKKEKKKEVLFINKTLESIIKKIRDLDANTLINDDLKNTISYLCKLYNEDKYLKSQETITLELPDKYQQNPIYNGSSNGNGNGNSNPQLFTVPWNNKHNKHNTHINSVVIDSHKLKNKNTSTASTTSSNVLFGKTAYVSTNSLQPNSLQPNYSMPNPNSNPIPNSAELPAFGTYMSYTGKQHLSDYDTVTVNV